MQSFTRQVFTDFLVLVIFIYVWSLPIVREFHLIIPPLF